MRTRTRVLTLALSATLFTAATAVAGPAAVSAPTTFTHPGVLVSKAQLDFVRQEVNAGAEPWKSAYNQMMSSSYASLTRTPTPFSTVECGPYSNPDIGCDNETKDAIAAYTQALAWYITGDSAHATKAIEIMDAWSATITGHTGSNAMLQTAWAGSVWARAAEIIRYLYTPGWPNAARFKTMLRNVYLPEVINGDPDPNGNWELVMTEAAQAIAVDLDDRTSYDKAVSIFEGRVPAYVYLTSDGALPKYPPRSDIDTPTELKTYWNNPTSYVQGLSQETCRDFAHTGYAIASIAHVAETSRIQGENLYPEVQDRLQQMLEFHTAYENAGTWPTDICPSMSTTDHLGPVTEVAYNALKFRQGIPLPETEEYTANNRPQGTEGHFIAWETLTHAKNPN